LRINPKKGVYMDEDIISATEAYFFRLADDDRVPDVNEIITEAFGTKWDVGGYNALEAIERHNHSRASLHHGHEALMWYRGLSLYLAAIHGDWPAMPEGAPIELVRARSAQIDLLGICLSTSKVAVDTLLSGYVGVAFGCIRNMLETVLHCENLFAFPEDASYFYGEPTKKGLERMRVAEIKIRLVNHFGGPEIEQPGHGTQYIVDLYDSWKFTSSGSHPSPVGIGFGLSRTRAPFRQIGSNYQPYTTLQGFERGLRALMYLLLLFRRLSRVDTNWLSRYQRWQDSLLALLATIPTHPAVIELEKKVRNDQLEDRQL
jgi:hypothetical protein